jgi:hypothetical protein
MPWNEEKRNAVFEWYWEDGKPRCPDCRADVQVEFNLQAPDYILLARCSKGCGDLQMSRKDDPRNGTFRRWTDIEIRECAERLSDVVTPCCQIDGATLEFPNGRDFNKSVMASCPRCGNRALLHRSHVQSY